MTEAGVNVVHRSRLDADEVRAVLRLVDDVTDTDGTRPLSEHVMLHLRYGGDSPASNYLAWSGDELAGYAHLDTTDTVEGASAEVAVGPRHRGMGIGKSLVEALLGETGDGSRVRLWAHGQSSGAVGLARSMGFRRERVLWQMRRSLYAPVPAPQWPDDVNVRTFVVGQDEEPWLEVNNRAFAAHPDQGTWTLDDLRMRECEPWFDPSGFFLAETDGRLVGFHWTKVHGADPSATDHEHAHEPIGEVYVVGIDPSVQGRGLGPALTLRGLQYLRARGLSQCMLYVDEVNTNAIRTYERLGFAKWDVDICFLQG
jgi:mycothiol synthase